MLEKMMHPGLPGEERYGMAERLQIKFEFNSVEDRLLLRISEMEREACVEYRFWLTRRFVRIFIGAIDKLIERELASDMQISPDAMEAMKKFQQEAALARADFSTSFGAGAENCTMSGDVPLLVSTLKLKKKSKNRYVLSFLTQENGGIHLTAGIDLIHSLRKMFFDSANNAEWNKPLFAQVELEDEKAEPARLSS